jgi:Protein of unknown function (DUF3297)
VRFGIRHNDGASPFSECPMTSSSSANPVSSPVSCPEDVLPDRLSIDPNSTHYNEAALRREIGIRFKGAERSDVEEYCISEAWIKVAAGRAIDRRGRPILIKLKGTVEAYYKSAA